jgi:hypothetical protein
VSIVLIEITFSGTPLFSADGRLTSRFLKGWPGTPPMVRGEDDIVAAMTGRSFYPKVADHLDIELEVAVAEEDEATFRTQLTALYTLFAGTAAPATLSALLEDGATATIDAYVVPPVLTRERLASLVAQVDVSLTSLDPAWVITPAP